jgi:hypothetical protein
MEIVEPLTLNMNTSDLPPEFKTLYDTLLKKVNGLIAGGHMIDIKNDPTMLRVIIESAMAIVEDFRTTNEKALSGPEKKRIALTLIKCVITDLSKSGKINPTDAEEIIKNLDFWGGVAMDVAVDAVKSMFLIGQKVAVDVGVFAEDAKKVGCSEACKKDCCCIIC